MTCGKPGFLDVAIPRDHMTNTLPAASIHYAASYVRHIFFNGEGGKNLFSGHSSCFLVASFQSREQESSHMAYPHTFCADLSDFKASVVLYSQSVWVESTSCGIS